MLRDLNVLKYIPILSLRPAEMNALEQLPEKDKTGMLPLFLLKPWLSANQLISSFDRINKSYGDRPFILDIDPNYQPGESERDVHIEFENLKSAQNGFENWRSITAAYPNIIPCLQLSKPDEMPEQLHNLLALNRGIAVRIPEAAFGVLDVILQTLTGTPGNEILIVLDYGQQSNELLTRAAGAIGRCETVIAALPNCHIAISATSFPSSFVGLVEQDIYERRFYNEVDASGTVPNLIYSDRGSAREERIGGGGGTPAPRIDYPLDSEWKFHREDKRESYVFVARQVMATSYWDDKLRIWGTQMIERTARMDSNSINSPVRATAVRINMHLHRQLFHGDPEGLHDTDDDWEED